MGLLTVGKPLSWEESKDYLNLIRKNGITQFLQIYERTFGFWGHDLFWGDEIEYAILTINNEEKIVQISLDGTNIQNDLNDLEKTSGEECLWHAEYGAWMVESTPGRPYSKFAGKLLDCEKNMRLRRGRLINRLKENQIAPTMTAFPLLGVGNFSNQPGETNGPIANSDYIFDNIINPHPRFGTLTKNIRTRRGQNVNILVPLYQDINTPEFQDNNNSNNNNNDNDLNKFIHMDAMAFGMGCCCLQVTFQAKNIQESRYLYDQLVPLAPIMLALTGATPFLKGRIADTDVRWDVISNSVDDRTDAERGLIDNEEEKNKLYDEKMVNGGIKRQYKSRYGSVSRYLYHDEKNPDILKEYNDIPAPIDEESYNKLLEAGIDQTLSYHIAHLFSRDPLVIFEGQTDLGSCSTEHFESLQSTNWQTIRWKPPPPQCHQESKIGWRVEFRSMELQLTDFENAAFSVFLVLLTRVILAFDLNLYLPLSKVDLNMKRAHKRNAAQNEKFYFRKYFASFEKNNNNEQENEEKDIDDNLENKLDEEDKFINKPRSYSTTSASSTYEETLDEKVNLGEIDNDHDHDHDHHKHSHECKADCCLDIDCPECRIYEEMTLNEIFNGKKDFPGLINLVREYLYVINCSTYIRSKLNEYLDFIQKRARGDLITPATYLRNFVMNHPSYEHDSVLKPDIVYDIVQKCNNIGTGKEHCPEILGTHEIEPIQMHNLYDVSMDNLVNIDNIKRHDIINGYFKRASFEERSFEN